MRIVTFFTDSHRVLFDGFVRSLRQTNPRLELLAYSSPQRSTTGAYLSPGFHCSMVDKLDCILRALKVIRNGDFFIYADCDVQFFGDIVADFEQNLSGLGADMYFQDDVCGYCAGFWFCRKNSSTEAFLQTTKSLTRGHTEYDQGVMNDLISNGESPKVCRLPLDRYFTVAAAIGCQIWRGEVFEVPDSILMHHGNWTVGLEAKIKLMEFVRHRRCEKRTTPAIGYAGDDPKSNNFER